MNSMYADTVKYLLAAGGAWSHNDRRGGCGGSGVDGGGGGSGGDGGGGSREGMRWDPEYGALVNQLWTTSEEHSTITHHR